VRKAGALRIGCAEVEQSNAAGRFAEELRLQFLEADAFVPDFSNGTIAGFIRQDLWRTAAVVQGINGSVVQLQMTPSAASSR